MTGTDARLVNLGWDSSWRQAVELAQTQAAVPTVATTEPGRVTRVDRGLCTVETAGGSVRATLGGAVLAAAAADPLASVCAGDWCVLASWPDGPVTIEATAARRTRLIRAEASRGSGAQVIAANVDVVGAVVALDPEPRLERVERLVSLAWESGASPVVLLTKADLVVDAPEIAEDVEAVAPGVPVLCCSAPENRGLDDVRALVPIGKTLALVGASGHGKSSLVNALLGSPELAVRSIRADGRGRHTSVRRELHVIPGGGCVIDTPGLRGIGLHQDESALARTFADIAALATCCRYADCRHDAEPGCAVRAALDDGELSVRRWESWCHLLAEVRAAELRSTYAPRPADSARSGDAPRARVPRRGPRAVHPGGARGRSPRS